jgi:hypothetical protein
MHLPASRDSSHLPKHFPVGTTYVVEGRGGEDGHLRVFSRYVVLPGGQRINLAADFGGPASSRTRSRARATAAKTRPKAAKTAAPPGPKKLWLPLERAADTAVDGQMPGEAPQPLTLNHPALNPGRFSGWGSSFGAWPIAENSIAAVIASRIEPPHRTVGPRYELPHQTQPGA